MRVLLKITFLLAIAGVVLSCALNARAFALLGPFEPWMTATNGFYPSSTGTGDIGGPMCLSNGYRWNVPVVTYGFDQSFLNFFGTNGVAAVQSAIQILNDLPPASQIDLSNYPAYSRWVNYQAKSQSLYDLKSLSLRLLVEQMGLAQPSRYVFVLRRWDPIFVTSGLQLLYGGYVFHEINWVDDIIPNNIVQRNFDPETLGPSTYVNGIWYQGRVFTLANGDSFVQTYFTDPTKEPGSAVADELLDLGEFYRGLTFDDVGGLRYLLSTNNINYETLLPDIVNAGTNAGSLVNGAWRPGVDKITFLPHAVDAQSGSFVTMTNFFTDTYITNGAYRQQQVARIISHPDFLFSVSEVTASVPGIPIGSRTGTTNWLNNAALNGNTNGGGPGIIQPPVRIVFNKLGKMCYSGAPEEDVYDESVYWGSFDNSTNALIVYPAPQTGTNQMIFHLWLSFAGGTNLMSFDWKPVSAMGTEYALQTSTNMTDWVTLFNVTNNNTISGYVNEAPSSSFRFYRLIPQ